MDLGVAMKKLKTTPSSQKMLKKDAQLQASSTTSKTKQSKMEAKKEPEPSTSTIVNDAQPSGTKRSPGIGYVVGPIKGFEEKEFAQDVQMVLETAGPSTSVPVATVDRGDKNRPKMTMFPSLPKDWRPIRFSIQLAHEPKPSEDDDDDDSSQWSRQTEFRYL